MNSWLNIVKKRIGEVEVRFEKLFKLKYREMKKQKKI